MPYQAPFYAFPPVAPPVLPQAFPIAPTFQNQEAYCDAGMQAASWEQSIPFATHPLSFSPPTNIHNMTYQQSEVDSTDCWGPVPSPPISAIATNSNGSWISQDIGQDEPSEDEIPMQSIARCRSG